MGNVQVVSSAQNKANQKKAVHMSSSTVFLAISSGDGKIDTEVSMLNHFILKRGISDVVATFEFRDLNGKPAHILTIKMNEPRAYSVRVSEHIKGAFLGSIYVYFKSNENLAVPFCAVMCSISTRDSICGVHTYGRRLEQKELGGSLDLKSTVEQGWTSRDARDIRSFAVLHGGYKPLDLDIKLVISNAKNETLIIEQNHSLQPYGTLLIIPQEWSDKVVLHLGGGKGHIKVHIEGLSGIFPRMLCGNFSTGAKLNGNLDDAIEMQFTHTNFDFSIIEQPDSSSSLGYFNQPSVPAGYGIIYPVETSKQISIGNNRYVSNSLHHIEIESMAQLEITAAGSTLPSRFVAATLAKWDGAVLESECSSGTFIKDYLSIPCHWHWGLLKPGLEIGCGVISVFRGNFRSKNDMPRSLKLRIFSEEKLVFERDIEIDGNDVINVMDMLPCNVPEGALWYVLTGEKLEDLNIFSTFYPSKKAGFVEHAF